MRKCMISSKMFKMPQLKEAVLKISSLRENIVYDEYYNSEMNSQERNTLFDKLGGLDGLTKIMEHVFSLVEKDT